jgi:hypothetical protein
VVWHLDSGLLGFEAVRILIGKKSAFNTARCCWQKKLRRQPLASATAVGQQPRRVGAAW